jgi:hypothetical protein
MMRARFRWHCSITGPGAWKFGKTQESLRRFGPGMSQEISIGHCADHFRESPRGEAILGTVTDRWLDP